MSEFGRGYATCLIQFTFHRPRLADDMALYQRMAEKYPDDRLFTPKHSAEIWANGASDHLYELIRPRSGVKKADWLAAKRLQDRALDVGHGFQDTSASTPEECAALLDEAERLLGLLPVATLDEAVAWDTAHGLRPDTGSWSCRESMPRRPA